MQHTIKFIDNTNGGADRRLKFIGDNENSNRFPDSNYQEVDADGNTIESYFTTWYVCECVRDGDWTAVAFILTADNGTSFTVGDEPSTEQEDEEELKIVRGKNLRIQMGYYSDVIEVFTYDAGKAVWLCEAKISWTEKEIQDALDEGSWTLLEVIEPSDDDKKDNLPRVDLLIDLGYEDRKEVFTYDADDDSWTCEDEMTWTESDLREEFENGCWSLIGPALEDKVKPQMPNCTPGSVVFVTHRDIQHRMKITRMNDGWGGKLGTETYWTDEEAQRFLDIGVWSDPNVIRLGPEVKYQERFFMSPDGSIIVHFGKFSRDERWNYTAYFLNTGERVHYGDIDGTTLMSYEDLWNELPSTITLRGQWKADGTVDAFRTHLKEGDAMFIPTNEDGGVYVTRAEAITFFGL